MTWPDTDVDIDAPLVASLLESTEFADATLQPVAFGFDNDVWRAGDVGVRLPRRAVAAELMEQEIRWLNEVTRDVPLETPHILHAGTPQDRYPYPWAIVTWLDGTTALDESTILGRSDALRLATALAHLHQIAPHDAPMNPFRGVPLSRRVESFERTCTVLHESDAAFLTPHFQRGLAASAFSGQPRWIHGDLHLGNLVIREDSLVGIIDFGDMAGGDPACDLGGALMCTRPSEWNVLTETYVGDDAMWLRARGWLAAFVAMHLTIEGAHERAAKRLLALWREVEA